MMMKSLITGSLTLPTLLLLLGIALVLGLFTALVFRFKSKQSASFTLALTLLPMIVTVVIMLVNGNIGTGVAVAGAFALVRFRSIPGTAREIAAIFTAMALGLALGLGYAGIACLLFVGVAVVTLSLTLSGLASSRAVHKQLKITIPEDLDHNALFDDVFAAHGVKAELIRIKSTAMGTLFDLTYDVTLPSAAIPKAFLDDLRARNSNLTIMIGAVSDDDAL